MGEHYGFATDEGPLRCGDVHTHASERLGLPKSQSAATRLTLMVEAIKAA